MRESITLKISITILIVETVFLLIMGVVYVGRFSREIDRRLFDKLSLPGTLMSQSALNFDSVEDLSTLEKIVGEKVLNAFILRKDGDIFFAPDPSLIGSSFADAVTPFERKHLSITERSPQILSHRLPGETHHFSILTPIEVGMNFLGFLYIDIAADGAAAQKKSVALLFFLGSALTILMTSLVEALWVHRLFVPRLRGTVAALASMERGDYTSRISETGSPDQIGKLGVSVNLVIQQIESHTASLESLTLAGEDFASAHDHDEIQRIILSTVTRFLHVNLGSAPADDSGPVKRPLAEILEKSGVSPLAGKMIAEGDIVLVGVQTSGLPMSSPGGGGNFTVRVVIPLMKGTTATECITRDFLCGDRYFSEKSSTFLKTLSRLMVNALRRMEALASLTKAEKEYRDLFTLAEEGIFRISTSGTLLSANPALSAMTGHANPAEMISLSTDPTSGFLAPESIRTLLYSAARGTAIKDLGVDVCHKDGSHFPASLWARPLKGSDGEIVWLEGGVIDTSERKKREEAERHREIAMAADRVKTDLLSVLESKNRDLSEALDNLKNAQSNLLHSEKMAAIGTMAGGVAHDLNNILSGIVSYPDLLLAELPPESEYREIIHVIKESGARAAAVVADLLALSRGTVRNTVVYNVNDLVDRYTHSDDFHRLSRRFPSVALEVELSPDLRNIKCSPGHIEKILINLTENAFEAAGEEGRVRISSENSVMAPHTGELEDHYHGNCVAFTVSDTGPAISPEDIENIFEPFYTKKIPGRSGTGLALSVVWNTTREHGGVVSAASDENGASFTVSIPAVEEISAHTEEPVFTLDQLKGSGTVLVVDDERQLRDVAVMMLSTLGYSAVSVPSGEEALEYLRQKPVDIVLLDMVMANGMSGYESYRAIIGERPGQKAIICTGYSSSSDVGALKELGITRILKKPFTFEEIGKAVKEEISS